MDVVNIESFGSVLNELIKMSSISCNVLANELNYEVSTVYKWLNDKRKPSKKYIESISESIAVVIYKYIYENKIVYDNICLTLDNIYEKLGFEKPVHENTPKTLIENIKSALLSSYYCNIIKNKKAMICNNEESSELSCFRDKKEIINEYKNIICKSEEILLSININSFMKDDLEEIIHFTYNNIEQKLKQGIKVFLILIYKDVDFLFTIRRFLKLIFIFGCSNLSVSIYKNKMNSIPPITIITENELFKCYTNMNRNIKMAVKACDYEIAQKAWNDFTNDNKSEFIKINEVKNDNYKKYLIISEYENNIL